MIDDGDEMVTSDFSRNPEKVSRAQSASLRPLALVGGCEKLPSFAQPPGLVANNSCFGSKNGPFDQIQQELATPSVCSFVIAVSRWLASQRGNLRPGTDPGSKRGAKRLPDWLEPPGLVAKFRKEPEKTQVGARSRDRGPRSLSWP